MKTASQVEDFQFVLCPGSSPDQKYIEYYGQIYNAWHDLWSSTYAELNDKSPLYSDAFTRQDFIAAIFYRGKCLAFILFRHADLSLKACLDDSYFQQWSEIHLKKVARNGKNILICSNLGVVPQARKESLGLSMKDLMVGLVTKLVIESAADALIATPRKDRGVDSAAYRWGGNTIAKDIDWGLNVTVDLIALYKEELLKNRNHELVPLVDQLWDRMLVIPQTQLESVNSFLKNNTIPFRPRKAG